MFGENTLMELFSSFENTSEDGQNRLKLFEKLPSRSLMKEVLESSQFKLIHDDYEIIKVHFPCMMDLVKWINNYRTALIGGKAANDLFLDPFILNDNSNSEYVLFNINKEEFRSL